MEQALYKNPCSAMFNEAELKLRFDYAIKFNRTELFSQKEYKY